MIPKDGAHVIARQGGGALGIVPVGLEDASAGIHAIEAAVQGAHPEAAVPVLDDRRDPLRTERSGVIEAEMREGSTFGLPSIQTLCGADPHGSRTVQRESQDLVVAERVGIRRIVPEMFESPGPGVEHIDAGIVASDPDASTRVDRERPGHIARQRIRVLRVVVESGKGIGGAVPSGEPGVLDRDPQIVMSVLGDLADEIAGQPLGGARIGVSVELVTVVAHQAILGGDPDEPLRILEHGIDPPLRKPVRGGEVIENERRRLRGTGRDRAGEQPRRADQQTRSHTHIGIHPATMHQPPRRWIEASGNPRSRAAGIGRCTSHFVHWFGTQFSIDADCAAPPGEAFEVHQGTDFAQV